MSLSFAPTPTSLSLWWAVLWRYLVMSLLLFVPLVAVVFVIQLPMVFSLPLAHAVSPYFSLALTIFFVLVNLVLQWVLLPVTVYAFTFRWLFRKGSFGKNAISGTYRGAPATTVRNAFKFSAWFFLECFKYVWPLFLGGMFIGFAADKTTGTFPPHVIYILLALMPLGIYLHMLVLSDLIKRRRFNRLELIVKPLTTTAKAQPLELSPEKPAAKPAVKPAAKPVAKAVAKPAPKVAAKPVAKAKPAAKPVIKAKAKPVTKPAAKAKPKAKK